MGRPQQPPISNSAADRAGAVLRRVVLGKRVDREEVGRAYEIASAYRDLHADPMSRVTTGVRSMVRTVTRDDSVRPGQRFKRMDRIIAKLTRFTRMRLSQMEDIGGCRVVLPTLGQVHAVADRIMGRWEATARLTDYIAEPKADGYRGIHIVERRDGRLIEVQLRTGSQQAWAAAVETWTPPAVPFSLKDGEGPELVRTYFERAAYMLALQDAGEDVDATLRRELAELQAHLQPYLPAEG